MSYQTILVEREDAVASIRLNRPDKLNALNSVLRGEVIRAVDLLSADDRVKVLVFTGAGNRAFAAGADISEFAASSADDQRRDMSARTVYDVVYECPKPTIAAIHGYCLGGGCELASSCDIRIADRSARFGQPEIRLGLIPGGGGTQRLPRLIGPGQTLLLSFTGDQIDAEEAYRIGLIQILVEEGAHLRTATDVARRIARWSASSLRMLKLAVRASMEKPLSEGLTVERDLFLAAFASEDGREGVRAFLEKSSRGERG